MAAVTPRLTVSSATAVAAADSPGSSHDPRPWAELFAQPAAERIEALAGAGGPARSRLYRLALWRTGRQGGAEEAVQEAFVGLASQLEPCNVVALPRLDASYAALDAGAQAAVPAGRRHAVPALPDKEYRS